MLPPNSQVIKKIHERSTWGSGPWDQEPDRVQWRDQETGIVCLIKRNPMGAWCGYVGVEPGHEWHGLDTLEVGADVHGGVTYSAHCDDDPVKGICHVPQGSEPDHLFWVGFDCAHFGDLAPRMDSHGTYRDMSYVIGQVRELARQAHECR